MSAQGAWYARSGSKVSELYTIMHLPYTSMVLSYTLIGAAFAPTIYMNRLILTLVAYFLGLGLSAHALNELNARHWGKALTKIEMQVLFVAPLIGALVIGVYATQILYSATGTLSASVVLLLFMGVETFFLFAYNTEFSRGRFHSDLAFAFSWGALPTLVSFYVNALTITVPAIFVSTAMAATAGIEISLSRWCKEFRRRNALTMMRFSDSSEVKLNTTELIARPEKALKLIVAAVDLAAIGLILHQLIP